MLKDHLKNIGLGKKTIRNAILSAINAISHLFTSKSFGLTNRRPPKAGQRIILTAKAGRACCLPLPCLFGGFNFVISFSLWADVAGRVVSFFSTRLAARFFWPMAGAAKPPASAQTSTYSQKYFFLSTIQDKLNPI